MSKKSQPEWYVYILECSDGTYYTGVTTDIGRRLHEHNNTKKGSKYVSRRRPASLDYVSDPMDKVSAFRREYVVKKMSHTEKRNLISLYDLHNWTGRCLERY